VAAPDSEFTLISETASLETSLTGETHTALRSATQLTVVVVSDRDCDLSIEKLIGASTWVAIHSEEITADTAETFTYAGNFGTVRPVVTVTGSSAWDLTVTMQAS
jgi:hypothetical protein